ncbi:MAG: radical SAM protein [Lachnospiraceae bacterium]|nr:radical SAM protein [Lachnospiraceae bacterium]
MLDRFGREITYLRMSVTEQCNLRCRYCMPVNAEPTKDSGGCTSADCEGDLCGGDGAGTGMLTLDEMITAVRAAASLGIKKVRITGGEPLIRHDIVSICERTAAVSGIDEVCITTNGLLLEKYAKELAAAGVRHVNISLDTLDSEKYEYITGQCDCPYASKSSRDGAAVTGTGNTVTGTGNTVTGTGNRIGCPAAAAGPDRVLAGLEAALAAGFEKVKINTVLIGDFNDDEAEALAGLTLRYPIDVRFIELMPMTGGVFGPEAYISADEVLKRLKGLEKAPDDGVARMYRLPGAKGGIGLISPVSAHFCAECSRLRLTADGRIKPCLHSREEYSIRGLDEAGMRARMEEAILAKPEMHPRLSYDSLSEAGRSMNRIGG